MDSYTDIEDEKEPVKTYVNDQRYYELERGIEKRTNFFLIKGELEESA